MRLPLGDDIVRDEQPNQTGKRHSIGHAVRAQVIALASEVPGSAVIDYVIPNSMAALVLPVFNNMLFVMLFTLAMFVNSAVIQGYTGRSLGKMAMNTKLCVAVWEGATDQPWRNVSYDQWRAENQYRKTFVYPGIWRCAGRLLAHFFDFLPGWPHQWLCLGIVWPLIDTRYRCFADMICKTVVLDDDAVTLERRTDRHHTRLLNKL